MIIVTRLNGPTFAVNPDLIERAESNPDTVLTLVDGTKYVIAETLDELIEAVRNYRASIIAAASAAEHQAQVAEAAPPARAHSGEATIVPLPARDR